MNFRSWQRWQLIEYALLQKISEEKAVENGKALPQTKQECCKIGGGLKCDKFHSVTYTSYCFDSGSHVVNTYSASIPVLINSYQN